MESSANRPLDRISGIIFDYGGTIDSRGDHWSHVIRQAYRDAGVPVRSEEAFREAYVYAERELARVRHILPHHTFGDLLLIKMRIELDHLADNCELPADASARWAEPVAQLCDRAARDSVEEARPVLEQLYARYPMVLVSNFYGNVEAVLEAYDLRRYFGAIIESAVVGVRKPDPRIFELGVEALGLPADRVLVVGDSLRKDILPAESIGCQTLWLKGRGWTPEEDAATHPGTIRSLHEVAELLL